MTYPNYRISIQNRILSNSVKRENGCIEYASGGLKHKYGLVSITMDKIRKSVPAHRALYMATRDCLDLPSNIYIRHTCDNPCCVNMEHLVRGTPKDNPEDCIERGRRATKYKTHTRQVKLDNETVIKIRESNLSVSLIAFEFGISQGYVSKLRNRKAKTLI